MLFIDPFAGGGNVSIAASQHGFKVVSSDLYTRLYPWVTLRDYREVSIPKGCVVWASPPCRDYSMANPLATFSDGLFFENPTVFNADTVLLENVPRFVVNWARLQSVPGFFSFGGVFDLSCFGALQKRKRFIGVLSRDRTVVERATSFFMNPCKPDYNLLKVFWASASFLGDVDAADITCLPGNFRKHTGRGTERYYSMSEVFPTFTRSNLSRCYALKTGDFGLPTGEFYRLEGLNLSNQELMVDYRTATQSIIGDGVPFRFVKRFLATLF